MMSKERNSHPPIETRPAPISACIRAAARLPLPNYTLSSVCPACDTPTFRHACKVRCPRCGFVWDCSEL